MSVYNWVCFCTCVCLHVFRYQAVSVYLGVYGYSEVSVCIWVCVLVCAHVSEYARVNWCACGSVNLCLCLGVFV